MSQHDPRFLTMASWATLMQALGFWGIGIQETATSMVLHFLTTSDPVPVEGRSATVINWPMQLVRFLLRIC